MSEEYGRYDDEQKPKRKIGLNVLLGIMMIAIYLGMSYLLLATSLFSNLYDWVRYMMGAVFFVYGIFRGYRLFKGLK
jgi:hypothetical protein